MFSGIVEEMATVVAIKQDKENIDFTLKCSFVDELSIDQSVAHNGVCLTVVEIKDGTYTVTAMKETLDRIAYTLAVVGIHIDFNPVAWVEKYIALMEMYELLGCLHAERREQGSA